MSGWIKLHRKTLDNPIVCKDSDHLAVWIYLLLNATHKEYPGVFKGKKIILQPGQLITGRKSIASQLRVHESKVQRILTCFENEHQIEQLRGNNNRLVTILSWLDYQENEQLNEQQMNIKRTTDEQLMNTNKNVKNDKNDNKEIIKDIVLFLNEKTGKKFSSETSDTVKYINARLREGFTLEDFKKVIDNKVRDWSDNPKMKQYLRPSTLFSPSKFEGYLNQGGTSHESNKGYQQHYRGDQEASEYAYLNRNSTVEPVSEDELARAGIF